MKDRVPKYPGRVKLVPVTGQENTFDMLRADEPTQPGDPLSKATFLKDATAAMLGLDENAVPDDAFTFLGKYNLHWWKRVAQEIKTVYTESSASCSFEGLAQFTFANAYYSDAYTVNPNTGEVSLVNPVNIASKDDIYGHYVKGVNGGISFLNGGVQTANNADVFYVTKKNNYVSGTSSDGVNFSPEQIGLTRIYSVATKINAGETSFVHSSDRNAYPDSGINNGFEYAYLGIPFDNAVTAPKIELGKYVGTGKAGSSNKNSLTFSVDPKFVFIGSAGHVGGIFYVKEMGGTQTFTPDLAAGIKFSLSGKTLTWYNGSAQANDTNTVNVGLQLNSSGVTYRYVAIG